MTRTGMAIAKIGTPTMLGLRPLIATTLLTALGMAKERAKTRKSGVAGSEMTIAVGRVKARAKTAKTRKVGAKTRKGGAKTKKVGKGLGWTFVQLLQGVAVGTV